MFFDEADGEKRLGGVVLEYVIKAFQCDSPEVLKIGLVLIRAMMATSVDELKIGEQMGLMIDELLKTGQVLVE